VGDLWPSRDEHISFLIRSTTQAIPPAESPGMIRHQPLEGGGPKPCAVFGWGVGQNPADKGDPGLGPPGDVGGCY